MLKKSRFIFLLLLSSILYVQCSEGRFKQGKTLYEFHCAPCHMDDGTGLAHLYPPLNNADWLIKNKALLPEIMRYGIQDTLIVNGGAYTYPMEGNLTLSAVEISNISNYILTAWDNQMTLIPFDEIIKSLDNSGMKNRKK